MVCQNKSVITVGGGGAATVAHAAGFRQFTIPDDGQWHKFVRRGGAININIQNNSKFDVKINYDNSPGEPLPAAWEGMLLVAGDERNYDSRLGHEPYFRTEPGKGAVTLDIEELQGV